jgi:hypothetical protein
MTPEEVREARRGVDVALRESMGTNPLARYARELERHAEAMAGLASEIVNRLLSFCDASNWDSDGKRGDYYRGWKEATDAVHEIASDFQEAAYAEARPPSSPVPDASKAQTDETRAGEMRCSVCGGTGKISAPTTLETHGHAADVERVQWARVHPIVCPKCGGSPTTAPDTAMTSEPKAASAALTDAQIKHMVDRFLCWRLPKPWHPDNGISYRRPNFLHAPADHDWPVGTNLFDAGQAEAMVRNMLEGMPVAPSAQTDGEPFIIWINDKPYDVRDWYKQNGHDKLPPSVTMSAIDMACATERPMDCRTWYREVSPDHVNDEYLRPTDAILLKPGMRFYDLPVQHSADFPYSKVETGPRDLPWRAAPSAQTAPSSPVPDASKAQTDETRAGKPIALRNFGYAPGGYWVHCNDCGEKFDGDKRAWRCKSCATVAAVQAQAEAATPARTPSPDIAALRERAEKGEGAMRALVITAHNPDGPPALKYHPPICDEVADLIRDLAAALPSTGTGEPAHRYRHVKSGGTYKVVAHGKLEWSLAPVVIYEAEKDGTIWVRPEAEFFDGRFERIAALSSPAKGER